MRQTELSLEQTELSRPASAGHSKEAISGERETVVISSQCVPTHTAFLKPFMEILGGWGQRDHGLKQATCPSLHPPEISQVARGAVLVRWNLIIVRRESGTSGCS